MRHRLRTFAFIVPALLVPGLLVQCGDGDHDDEGTEADQVGVAAQCVVDEDCAHDHDHEDSDGDHAELVCLTNFKGGYCGLVDCTAHEDCPDGSACVMHDDGVAYCFRLCVDKSECNLNREADLEANCSSNITWIGDDVGKACVPPEGA